MSFSHSLAVPYVNKTHDTKLKDRLVKEVKNNNTLSKENDK